MGWNGSAERRFAELHLRGRQGLAGPLSRWVGHRSGRVARLAELDRRGTARASQTSTSSARLGSAAGRTCWPFKRPRHALAETPPPFNSARLVSVLNIGFASPRSLVDNRAGTLHRRRPQNPPLRSYALSASSTRSFRHGKRGAPGVPEGVGHGWVRPRRREPPSAATKGEESQANPARNSRFRILPVADSGRLSRTSTRRGYL